MERKRKLSIAKGAVVLVAIPIVLWAYEYGPDAGHAGVPNELGTCAQSGCHVGTANNPANQGSVSVAFPAGLAYVPGVKQHLVVTIADPATTQKAWGFQLTARQASNTKNMAGSFASTDGNTGLMCAAASNPANELGGVISLPQAQTCPASLTLQYIEHNLTGYQASLGHTGSFTYEFDWTPPASDIGPVTIYVAANAAIGNLQDTNHDHIYTTTYTLAPSSGGPAPTINSAGVVNGASFKPGMVPGSWITIQGTNLCGVTDTWDKAIVNGKLPTVLDTVTVTAGGQPAYIYYVSPTQINALAPNVGTGSVSVTVSNANGTSAPISVVSSTVDPALFLWPNNQPVATHTDGTWAVKNGTFSGATTVAAKPGEAIILWGTGYGPTNPAAPEGQQTPSGTVYYTATPVTATINGAPASVYATALSPGFAGLYQVVVTVPATMGNGDFPLVTSINGASSPTVTLTVHN